MPLREKYPNTEFFLVHIFPHSDWIWGDTPYFPVFSPSAGKYGIEKTLHLNTFHVVCFIIEVLKLFRGIDNIKWGRVFIRRTECNSQKFDLPYFRHYQVVSVACKYAKETFDWNRTFFTIKTSARRPSFPDVFPIIDLARHIRTVIELFIIFENISP